MQIKYNDSTKQYIIGETKLTNDELINLIRMGTLPNILLKEESFIIKQKNIDYKNESENILYDITSNIIGRNIIYFGAPGTGKSFKVTQYIKETYPEYDVNNHENIFRVTVYPDYSYYNFVGSIMPIMQDDNIIYNFKPGVLTLALLKALEKPNEHIFLVIEEMSRGNIAAIFGDIFQLLDRKDNGYSEYVIDNELLATYLSSNLLRPINKVFLPSNLSIIGTVNTNDQNVNVIDTAFKRRFEFEYVSVEPIKDSNNSLNSFEFKLDSNSFEWNALYMALNLFITTTLNLNEDKQIGQFFIKFGNDEKNNIDLIKNKLLHYLWEDIQNSVIHSKSSIFKSSIRTFSTLYKEFELNKNIFSDEFLEHYKSFIIENSELNEN